MSNESSFPKLTSRDFGNNVAYIAFREIGAGDSAYSREVLDPQSETLMVLDFTSAGELLGIEFLDARVQLPKIF